MASKIILKKKNEHGFTLIETIVALGIGLLATTMVFYIFTLGLKNIQEIKYTQALNSSAIFFLDRATYLIKQGENFDTSDSNRLIIDGGTPNEISIDNLFFTANNIDTATTTFTGMTKSIRINFIIQEGSKILSATTTIAQRAF